MSLTMKLLRVMIHKRYTAVLKQFIISVQVEISQSCIKNNHKKCDGDDNNYMNSHPGAIVGS